MTWLENQLPYFLSWREEGAENGMETIPVGVSGMTEGDSRPQA